MRLHFIFSAVVLVLATSCGPAINPAVVTSPFTADLEPLFDDGVDFFAEPAALEGSWRDSAIRDTQGRADAADVVAVVEITTVHTDSDPAQRTSFRLVARVERTILGGTPSEDLRLSCREGAPGYPTVADNQDRLLNHRFVVYLKWYEAEGGQVEAHWHLSPASDGVLVEAERAVARRGQSSP